MNKSKKGYIEIFLNLLILAGLFMPYARDETPFDTMFQDSINYVIVFSLTIPVAVIIPFLLTLIFKQALGNSLLSILKVVFIALYVIILGCYISMLIEILIDKYSFGSLTAPLIAIVLSLNLILLSTKYSILRSDELHNIFLAIMTLPFIFALLEIPIFWGLNFNYGGYIINISFILLYAMAVINIYGNYNTNKQ